MLNLKWTLWIIALKKRKAIPEILSNLARFIIIHKTFMKQHSPVKGAIAIDYPKLQTLGING